MGDPPSTLGILLSGLLDAEKMLLAASAVGGRGGRREAGKEDERGQSDADTAMLVRPEGARRLTH